MVEISQHASADQHLGMCNEMAIRQHLHNLQAQTPGMEIPAAFTMPLWSCLPYAGTAGLLVKLTVRYKSSRNR